MNGLEIAALLIIVIFSLTGYIMGFLRVAYSLAAWVIAISFVTFATPYVTDFLETNTNIKPAIQESCEDYIAKLAEEKISQEANSYHSETQQEAGNSFFLPESIMKEITGAAGGLLADSGLYKEIAGQVAHYILKGIAFLLTMLIIGIVTFWISRMLDIVSRLPIIRGPNKALGAVMGGIKGIIFVWLFFFIVQLCSASELGKQFLLYINESVFLRFLYENNILMQILNIFL